MHILKEFYDVRKAKEFCEFHYQREIRCEREHRCRMEFWSVLFENETSIAMGEWVGKSGKPLNERHICSTTQSQIATLVNKT